MLKREITYKNWEDEDVTEVHYFNLSKPELVEWELEQDGGMRQLLQRIIDEKDNRELVKKFKEIILKSYGVRSDDGKRFIKNDQVRTEFEQTLAYEALFMELMEKEGAAEKFVTGILPADMVGRDQDKPQIGDTKPAPNK